MLRSPPSTLPGRPAVKAPTFDCQGSPSRSATVVDSGAGSPDSNEEKKSPGSAAAAGAAARTPTGTARGTARATASASPSGRAPPPERATARPGGRGLIMLAISFDHLTALSGCRGAPDNAQGGSVVRGDLNLCEIGRASCRERGGGRV